ncbi:MAG: hypothetical protein ABW123_11650 [Cystobacter sp.]
MKRVLEDTPVRSGHLELQAGVSTLAGPYVRGEAVYRATQNLGAFGFAQWTPRESMAGVGLRYTFGR